MSQATTEPSAAPDRPGPDAFGRLVYALYIGVGGLLVFMFAASLEGAVEVQNGSTCSALRPEFRSRVVGTVMRGGEPAGGVEVKPTADADRVKGATTDEHGRFTIMLPGGDHALAFASDAAAEATVLPLQIEGGRDIEARFDLDGSGPQVEASAAWRAPEINALDLAGKPVHLTDFRGKLVLVNFWATWCEPCITEWPQLDQLAARLGGRDDVVILAVSIDQNRADIQPFLDRMSLSDTGVTVVWDPSGEVHRAYGSEQIPDTYFVDEQGRLAAAFVNVRKWGNPEAYHCVDGTVGRAAG